MLLTTEEIQAFKEKVEDRTINLVLFDLETSPALAATFSLGESHITDEHIIEGTEPKIFTMQYINGLDSNVKYLQARITKGDDGWLQIDDSELLEKGVRILNSADIVLGQNIKSFDIKIFQERLKLLRLTPLNPEFVMDTLSISRKSFRPMSHSLDHRSRMYGLGGKIKMSIRDWKDLITGKTSLKDKMIPYGVKDAVDNNIIFWNDLPYSDLPKTTVYKIRELIQAEQKCTKCEEKRQSKFEVYKTSVKGVKGYKCKKCQYFWEVT
jgi:hypothetical protein